MTKNLKDLGKLKRELEVEIPLEEIKPAYDRVVQNLKSVKLRGFRPGKFPKGWMQKRFQEQMTLEAREQVIPQYFNQIADEMAVRPATRAHLEELSFDAKKPMKFKVTFEVCPELPALDYQKLKLEKQPVHIEPKDHETMIDEMRRNLATKIAKPAGSVAEEEDWVGVDFKKTVGEEVLERTDEAFELHEAVHPEVKSNILGMKVGEHKKFSFEEKEDSPENPGKTVTFELTLKELKTKVLPEMDEAFFQQFGPSKNEEEFHQFVEKEVKARKASQVKWAYYQALKEQLPGCYEAFELPEQLLAEREKDIEKELRTSKQEIGEEALASAKEEKMTQYQTQLRLEYILQQISLTESLKIDNEAMAQRLASISQQYGVHPNDFFQSRMGSFLYQQVHQQVADETVLNFLIEKVLGDTEMPSSPE